MGASSKSDASGSPTKSIVQSFVFFGHTSLLINHSSFISRVEKLKSLHVFITLGICLHSGDPDRSLVVGKEVGFFEISVLD